jgi:hypothetical protein
MKLQGSGHQRDRHKNSKGLKHESQINEDEHWKITKKVYLSWRPTT